MKMPQGLPSFANLFPEEAKALLFSKEYGAPLPLPDHVEFRQVRVMDSFCAGKAFLRQVEAEVSLGGKRFSFPFQVMCPKQGQPVPGVVHVNFTPAVPDPYLPTEELCDLGVAVASFCYTDVSPDDDDFASKAGELFAIDRSKPDAPGKLQVWAWAARVVMDYVQSCPEIDQRNVAVAGHSRLGKTALLAGLLDQRFRFVFACGSGCGGSALYHGKTGETAQDLCRVFPFWVCPAFQAYSQSNEGMDFDQHFVLSLIAPRRVYVACAAEDLWADPVSELRCCVAASPAFEAAGGVGLSFPGEEPQVGEVLHLGDIGYHLRPGCHYLSREDWQKFVAYLKLHKN